MPAACMRGVTHVRKGSLSEEFGPAGLGDMVSPGVERPGQFRFAMFQGSGNIRPPTLPLSVGWWPVGTTSGASPGPG